MMFHEARIYFTQTGGVGTDIDGKCAAGAGACIGQRVFAHALRGENYPCYRELQRIAAKIAEIEEGNEELNRW